MFVPTVVRSMNSLFANGVFPSSCPLPKALLVVADLGLLSSSFPGKYSTKTPSVFLAMATTSKSASPSAAPMTLFTPGPLQTSAAVKKAMLADYGSRDATFVEQVSFIRRTMLQIAEASEKDWACVLLQGPGTMGIEAAASTTTPRQGGRYLVLRSGKYAERMGEMTRRIGIDTVFFDTPEGLEIDLVALEAYLVANGPTLSNVGMVHHETSTGMLNPIQAVGALVRKYCRPDTAFIVDSMSAFGSVPCKVDDICDVLITSANKCLHGVPGFSIVLARRSLLSRCKGWSRSFTLDLSYQCAGLDKTGQFPFTPPVHTLMAFGVAVKEFLRDGGVAGRVARYKLLSDIVINGFTSIGFTLFLDVQNLSSFGRIVVAFNMPKHPKWDFKKFYLRLRKDGCIIYPGKASNAETFRVGLIGDLYEADMRRIVSAAEGYLVESGIGLGQNLDQYGHHNSDLPALRGKPSSSYTRKAKL